MSRNRRPPVQRPVSRALRAAELLEPRSLLAVSAAFDPSDGSLRVIADDDEIVVHEFAGNVLVNGADPSTGPLATAGVLSMHVSGGPATRLIDLSAVTSSSFPALLGTTIDFASAGSGLALMSQAGAGGGTAGGVTTQALALELTEQLVDTAPAARGRSSPNSQLGAAQLRLTNTDPASLERAAEVWFHSDWKSRLAIAPTSAWEIDDWRELVNSPRFVEAVDLDEVQSAAERLLGPTWQARLGIEDLESYVASGTWRQLVAAGTLEARVGRADARRVRFEIMAENRGAAEVHPGTSWLATAGNVGVAAENPRGQEAGQRRAEFLASRLIGPDWNAQLTAAAVLAPDRDANWSEIWNTPATWELLDSPATAALLTQLVGQDWAARLGILDLDKFLHSGQWRRLLTMPELAARVDELMAPDLTAALPSSPMVAALPLSTVPLDKALELGTTHPWAPEQRSSAASSSATGGGAGMALALMANPRTILGSGLPDHMVGTDDNDIINGGEGADTIEGLGGEDTIDGGEGYDGDTIFGGDGNDSIDGGEGNDRLDGGAGDDVIHGGIGEDEIGGDDGNDWLFGDSDPDIINGGEGDDVLYGGSGDDQLDGAEGYDVQFGDEGDDLLVGGTFDQFFGGLGFDSPETLDDADAIQQTGDYSETGAWSDLPEGFNRGARVHTPGAGPASATWNFPDLEPATYQVFATWSGVTGAATNARYHLTDDATFAVDLHVDQSQTPDDDVVAGTGWHLLGFFTVSSQMLSIRLDGDADGVVVADGFRLVRSLDSLLTIDPIDATTIDAGHLLSFTATATTAGVPPEELHFALDPGAPAGAAITSTGEFTWHPDPATPPGIYNIGIRVEDESYPPRAGVTIVAIEVFDGNQAPVLDPVGPRSIVAGQPLNVPLTAYDPNMPVDTFTWTLVAGPSGATVDADGFHWHPPADMPVGDYEVRVRVTDDGTPPLSDEVTFAITVAEPPLPNLLPEVAALELLDAPGAGGAAGTAELRIVGSVVHADGSVDGLPVEFDWNGDAIPDGVVFTDFHGSGEFVIDLAGMLQAAGPQEVRVRAGELDDAGLSYIFGDWETLEFAYSPNAPSAAGADREFRTGLEAGGGFWSGSLAPLATLPLEMQTLEFAGGQPQAANWEAFALRFTGPEIGAYSTLTDEETTTTTPPVGAGPAVVQTLTTWRQAVGTIDAAGNWTVSETVVASYLVVSTWNAAAEHVATLTQSGTHTYVLQASGSLSGSTYTLVESREDAFVLEQSKTVLESLGTGATRTTRETCVLEGVQGYELSAAGSAALADGELVTAEEFHDYVSYADQHFDIDRSIDEALGANWLQWSAADVGDSGWSYESQRSATTTGGGVLVAETFGYQEVFADTFSDAQLESRTTHTPLTGGGAEVEKLTSQSSLQGTKSVSYVIDGVRAAGGPAVVTDHRQEAIADQYFCTETTTREAESFPEAGAEVKSRAKVTVVVGRQRSFDNELGGTTTTLPGGARTYLGSSAGMASRDSTWSCTSEEVIAGHDEANPNNQRSFSSERYSTDIGSGHYQFVSSGTVSIDATGHRTYAGSSTALESKTGQTTAKLDQSSQLHSVATLNSWTTQTVDGASSSSHASQGSYQALSTGTAGLAPSGEQTKSGSSTYEAQVQGTRSYDHRKSALIVVDEQTDKRQRAESSQSDSHYSGDSEFVSKSSSESKYLNDDHSSVTTDEYQETGSEDSEVHTQAASHLNVATNEKYLLQRNSQEASQATSTGTYTAGSTTVRATQSGSDWETTVDRQRSDEAETWAHTLRTGDSKIEDRRQFGIESIVATTTSSERQESGTTSAALERSERFASGGIAELLEQSEGARNSKYELQSAATNDSSFVDASAAGTVEKSTSKSLNSYEGIGTSSSSNTAARSRVAGVETATASSLHTGSEEGQSSSQSEDTANFDQTDTSVTGLTVVTSDWSKTNEQRQGAVTRYFEGESQTYADQSSDRYDGTLTNEMGSSQWTSHSERTVTHTDKRFPGAEILERNEIVSDVEGLSQHESSEQRISQDFRDRTTAASQQSQFREQSQTVGETTTKSRFESKDQRVADNTKEILRKSERTEYPLTATEVDRFQSDSKFADGSRHTASKYQRTSTSRGPTNWTEYANTKTHANTTKDKVTTSGDNETGTDASGSGTFVATEWESNKTEDAATWTAARTVRREVGNSTTVNTRHAESETVNAKDADVDDTSWTKIDSSENRTGPYIDTRTSWREARNSKVLADSSASRKSESGELTVTKETDLIVLVTAEPTGANTFQFRHDWSMETGKGSFETLTETSTARGTKRTFVEDDTQVSGPFEWTTDTENTKSIDTKGELGVPRKIDGKSDEHHQGNGSVVLRTSTRSSEDGWNSAWDEDSYRHETGRSEWTGKGESLTHDKGTTSNQIAQDIKAKTTENWSGEESYQMTVTSTHAKSGAVTISLLGDQHKTSKGKEARTSTKITDGSQTEVVGDGTKTSHTYATDTDDVEVNYALETFSWLDRQAGYADKTKQREKRTELGTLQHTLTSSGTLESKLDEDDVHATGTETIVASDSAAYNLVYDWTVHKSAGEDRKEGSGTRTDNGHGTSTTTTTITGGAGHFSMSGSNSLQVETSTTNTQAKKQDYEYHATAGLEINADKKETYSGSSHRSDTRADTVSHAVSVKATKIEHTNNIVGTQDTTTTVEHKQVGRSGTLTVTNKTNGYVDPVDGKVTAIDDVTQQTSESDFEEYYDSTEIIAYSLASGSLTKTTTFTSDTKRLEQSDTRSPGANRILSDHEMTETIKSTVTVTGDTTKIDSTTTTDTETNSREVTDDPVWFTDVAYRSIRESTVKTHVATSTSGTAVQVSNSTATSTTKRWTDNLSLADGVANALYEEIVNYETTTHQRTLTPTTEQITDSRITSTHEKSEQRSGQAVAAGTATLGTLSKSDEFESFAEGTEYSADTLNPARPAYERITSQSDTTRVKFYTQNGLVLDGVEVTNTTNTGDTHTWGIGHWGPYDKHVPSGSLVNTVVPFTALLAPTFTFYVDPSAGPSHVVLVINEAWDSLVAGYEFAENIINALEAAAISFGGEVVALWRDLVMIVTHFDVFADAFFTDLPKSFNDGRAADSLAAAVDGALSQLVPLPQGYELPKIGPRFGNQEAYDNALIVGEYTGTALGIVVGFATGGGTGLVQCGSLAQKAARGWTAFETTAAMVSAGVNLHNGKAGIGDVLAFMPAMAFGMQKLRFLEDQCFVGETVVWTASAGALGVELLAEASPQASLAEASLLETTITLARGQAAVGCGIVVAAMILPGAVASRRARHVRNREERERRVRDDCFAALGREASRRVPRGPATRTSSAVSIAADGACALSLPDGARIATAPERPLTPRCARTPAVDKSTAATSAALPGPASPKRHWWWTAAGAFLFALLLIAASGLGRQLDPPAESLEPHGAASGVPKGAPPRRSASPLAKPIGEIRVGERVLADNPELDSPHEPLFPSTLPEEPPTSAAAASSLASDHRLWWIVRLRMRKEAPAEGDPATAGLLEIELLRPTLWLAEAAAIPGELTELNLPELGAQGAAEVVSVAPADAPCAGPGSVVTGKFVHSAANIVEVGVSGCETLIGCTASHPFWSADRQAFVPAGALRPGERLLTREGTVVAVTTVTPRQGLERVYNLEVDGQHVYYVSASGVLVHNGCALRENMKRRGVEFDVDDDAHHLVPQGRYTGRNSATQAHVAESQRILREAGIKIHNQVNGMPLSRVTHRGIHTNAYLKAVYERLAAVDGQGRDAVVEALSRIREDITNNVFAP